MIDWEKYNRSQAAISGLGFVEVGIKDYEEMRAALQPAILEQPTHTGYWLCKDYDDWVPVYVFSARGKMKVQFPGYDDEEDAEAFLEWTPVYFPK